MLDRAADEIARLRATLAERDAEIIALESNLELATTLRELIEDELAALKHDIARHVSICADQESEIAAPIGIIFRSAG